MCHLNLFSEFGYSITSLLTIQKWQEIEKYTTDTYGYLYSKLTNNNIHVVS